jgi:glyoxylate reductase
MARVVASAHLPFDISPILGKGVELEVPAEGSMPRPALLSALAGAEALIALLDVAVDAELLDAAPGLRIVANFAVGVDNVEVPEATRRGVVITNTPDVLTDATADFTFALLLGAARRLVEGDALARSGRWQGWQPGLLLGAEVAGRTLGIVGMGRIGQAVARRAAGFAMTILYASPRPSPAAAEHGARRVDLDELAAASDFVSLHCPLDESTRHLIDASFLARMKSSAYLINTARGGCVDEAALADAVAAREIAGAGLDVFADEPAIHPRLVEERRVVLAPHAGSATTGARRRMAEICARAVRSVLDGERPATVVNPEALP